ncbi:uncharacterized protein LOC117289163 [Asterias rubens]|uniref:uncharacterized protein LOC117289163 n=1 Tax=Asterias rubens TaxID=7604 RepID=UPI001454E61D|nr:uncharacterized protein LOC117289163 [Asterias rubens]
MLFGEVAGSVTNRGPNVGGSPLAWLGRREQSSIPLDSRCLKVTFNSESSTCKDDFRHGKQESLPKQSQASDATPSKDDVLSVVIQKLTELVNDSNKKRSRRSSLLNSCCNVRRAGSPERADPLHKCRNCPCLFTLNEKQQISKEKPLCNCCEKSKQARTILPRDVEVETDVGCSSQQPAKINCELCSHIADSYVNLLYHLSEHKDAKIFKCKLCDFFTTVQSRIVSHASVHNATHVYKCSSCPFVTGKLTSLQRHMKNHNRVNELLLKCSECGFSCRCEDALRNHMWEHVPADLHTSSRTPNQNPKEVVPMPGTLKASNHCSTATPDPAKVLPSQTTVSGQSYIFKCLLCGYLCDRLATLKAHAWRHAGETGCSYPIVDENNSLHQSLTKPCLTETPLESKRLPKEIESCSMVHGEDHTQRKEESCARETSRPSCGCGISLMTGQRETSSCRCVGINIPPSSLPLITDFLTHNKCENSAEKTSSKCDVFTKDLTSIEVSSNPAFVGETQLTSCHSNCAETVQQLDSSGSTSDDTLRADPCVSEDSQEKHQVSQHDPQVLFIDPDIPIPEPAANVEAITEQYPENSPKQISELCEDAFIPAHSSMKMPISFSFHKSSYASEIYQVNDKNSKSFGNESESQQESGTTSSFSDGRKSPSALREHVDAACSMMALTRPELYAGSINTVSYTNSPGHKRVSEKVSVLSQGSNLSLTVNKLQQKIDSQPECNKEVEIPGEVVKVEGENATKCSEAGHPILKQSESIQDQQTLKVSDSTFKRKQSFGHECPKGTKRVCLLEHADSDSQQNCPSVQDDSSENVASCHPDSEEDSVIKFFMSVINNSPEPFQCKLCTKTYGDYPSLKQHLQTHLVHSSFRCPLCKDCVESLESLKCHIQEHYNESYSCPECPAFFFSKSDLQSHRESHRVVKEYKCDMCDATFSGQVEFIEHQKAVHSERTLVKCTHCQEKFGNTNTLLLHSLSCGMRKRRYCKECSFSSDTAQGLQNHVRDSHSRAKFYKCTLCSYKSSAKNGIKNHMKFHATERPYKCDLCSFMGAYPQSLRSHMRMHNQPDWRPDCLPSELPEQYKCKFCLYTCNYLPSLKSHMWRHAGDPNYSYKDDQDEDADQQTLECSTVLNLEEHIPKQGTSSQTTSTTCGQGSEGKGNRVTFCCQECGFQSTDRNKLVDHLKVHLTREVLPSLE